MTAGLLFKTLLISSIVARIGFFSDSMLTAGMGFVKIRTIAVLLSLSLSSSFVLWWITPPDYSMKGKILIHLSNFLMKVLFKGQCVVKSVHI